MKHANKQKLKLGYVLYENDKVTSHELSQI